MCLCVLTLFAVGEGRAFPRFGPDNVHNLVMDGFAGGGTCDECHGIESGSIVGDKLLRWGTPDVDADGELCTANCHAVSSNQLPAAGTLDTMWDAVNDPRANPPPAYPHDYLANDCDTCHNQSFTLDAGRHATLNSTEYCNCLTCHTTGIAHSITAENAAGNDWGTDYEVDKFFAGVGDIGLTFAGHSDDHSIIYDPGGDLCTEADNECLKCHSDTVGAGAWQNRNAHPGVLPGHPNLFFPDTEGANTAGAAITLPQAGSTGAQWDSYYSRKRQLLCVSCHDRQLEGSAGDGAVIADIMIGGVQGPVMPIDIYAADIAGTAWPDTYIETGTDVLVVPMISLQPYEVNGHGRATSMEGTDMNLTCLSEETTNGAATPRMGCHSVHGSTSLSLLETGNFGDDVESIEEVGKNVCMSANCHSPARTGNYSLVVNNFHSMSSDGEWSHKDSGLSTMQWGNSGTRAMTVTDDGLYTMDSALSVPTAGTGSSNLRFYASRDASFDVWETQLTSSNLFGNSFIGCLTCHDPHGTSNEFVTNDNEPPDELYSTEGMLRRYKIEFDGSYPLCDECHEGNWP